MPGMYIITWQQPFFMSCGGKYGTARSKIQFVIKTVMTNTVEFTEWSELLNHATNPEEVRQGQRLRNTHVTTRIPKPHTTRVLFMCVGMPGT